MSPLKLWFRALSGREDSGVTPHTTAADVAPPPPDLLDHLGPAVAGLEHLRQTNAASFSFRARSATVLIVLGFAAVTVGFNTFRFNPVIAGMIWSLISAAALFWATAPYRHWTREVREVVLKAILQRIGQGYTLAEYGSVSTDRLRRARLLPRVDRIIAKHEIVGTLEGATLKVCEVRVKGRRRGEMNDTRQAQTLYHGLMAVWERTDRPHDTRWQQNGWLAYQDTDAWVVLGPVPQTWMRAPFLYGPIALTPFVTQVGADVSEVEDGLRSLAQTD